jgi:quinol monooxygenase YgiN
MRCLVLIAACVLLGLSNPCLAQDKEPEIITRLKAAKVDGPFTLIVHLKVKEGEGKTMVDAAKPCVAATLKEKGCIAYELHQDLEDPTRFVFFEKWQSVQALSDHLGTAHVKKLVGTLGTIGDGAPKFAIFRLTNANAK